MDEDTTVENESIPGISKTAATAATAAISQPQPLSPRPQREPPLTSNGHTSGQPKAHIGSPSTPDISQLPSLLADSPNNNNVAQPVPSRVGGKACPVAECVDYAGPVIRRRRCKQPSTTAVTQSESATKIDGVSTKLPLSSSTSSLESVSRNSSDNSVPSDLRPKVSSSPSNHDGEAANDGQIMRGRPPARLMEETPCPAEAKTVNSLMTSSLHALASVDLFSPWRTIVHGLRRLNSNHRKLGNCSTSWGGGAG